MKQVLIVAGLLLGPAAVAVAQQPRTQITSAGLSLADAIALARERNPAYRQAQNNRAPAAWAVRGAYSSLLIPSISVSGGMSYTGPGSQTFLSSSFTQSVSTVSSFYDLGLSWQLSGTTLSQPGLAKAQQHAADADIAGAQNVLITSVKQQYLTVLQARARARRRWVVAPQPRGPVPRSPSQRRGGDSPSNSPTLMRFGATSSYSFSS